MSKKIVFISHQASRTGAPIVLLHLLRWLKQHTSFHLTIVLGEGGELESEFRQVAETHVWQLHAPRSVWQGRWQRLIGHQTSHQRRIMSRLKQVAPDIIYANTIVSAPLGIRLKQQLQCPLVCHVHELGVVINEFIGREAFTRVSTEVDFFIAVAGAVAANLRQQHQIPATKITNVYEFVPVLDARDYLPARRRVRQELGIPDDAFVVAGAGPIDWRKAPDLFIQVAQHVGEHQGIPTVFIWPGGNLSSVDGWRVQHDVAHAGVEKQVHFLGAKANPYDYLSAADVFLLTSREDPYPLVCLEAASLGKPIICFADSGGMPEFVEQDCGFVVPYLRTDLMAAAVLQLRDSVELRHTLGDNAARKMRARHTIELAGQQINEMLNGLTQC